MPRSAFPEGALRSRGSKNKCNECLAEKQDAGISTKKKWGFWTCGKCKEQKPHSEFTMPKGKISGARRRCDVCIRQAAAEERGMLQASVESVTKKPRTST